MNTRLTLAEVQRRHAVWLAHNFGNVESYRPLLGIMEEVGELAHAHLKEVDGIRGTPEELQLKGKDAVGDIVHFLAGYCTTRGWSLEDCTSYAWESIKDRDWTKK